MNGVPGEDGSELDVFVGSRPAWGVVGCFRTHDHRKGDSEEKLLYGCTPEEIYLAHGFLNFAPRHMTAELALRWPLGELWAREGI